MFGLATPLLEIDLMRFWRKLWWFL